MLMPKRVKRRKVQRGRMKGVATRGNKVAYGDIGIAATEPCWITSNQIEAARITMTRYTKRGGKVWIKIFPDKPITRKPAETRMGSGKGNPEFWVAVVKPGRVLFEIAGVEALKKEILKMTGAETVSINIKEIKNPDLDATLIAESIANQLEKRVHFRRAMKLCMQKAMKAGAKGIKTMVGGRLDGADIARSEHYHQGSLPLHTLRADIDYGFAEAKTTFGILGVKVWVYKGEIYSKQINKNSTVKGGNDNVNA